MKIHSKITYRDFASFVFLFLIFGASLYRVIRVELFPDTFPNFSPLMAIALCGALFLPLSRLAALVIPLLALALSDILLNIHYGVTIFSWYSLATLLCYVGAAYLGLWLRDRKTNNLLVTLTAVLGSSVVFYLVTNTLAWFGNPAYAQSVGGWIQSLTIGLPGYPATWTFFRNSVTSDLIFALGFSLIALRMSKEASVSRVEFTI